MSFGSSPSPVMPLAGVVRYLLRAVLAGSSATQILYGTAFHVFSGTAWATLSAPPDHGLNLAYPDYAATYYISVFAAGESVTIEGSFPTWSDYAAVTQYDSDGIPSISLNKWLPNRSALTDFSLDFSSPTPYCVIYRVYRPMGVQWDSVGPAGLPTVRLAAGGAPYVSASLSSASFWGVAINKVLLSIRALIPSQASEPRPTNAQFIRPSDNSLGSGFANPDARYLIARYNFDSTASASREKVFVLSGTLPPSGGGFRFYGFMFSEASTTATWNSVFQEQFGGWGADFKVFVCRSQAAARAAGFDQDEPGHVVLDCSREKCPKPMVIFRQIHTEGGGLGQLDALAAQDDVPSELVAGALGAAYPFMTEVEVELPEIPTPTPLQQLLLALCPCL